MKYGLLWLTMGLLLGVRAIVSSGWWLVCLWPAMNLTVLGIAYLGNWPWIFGKRPNGRLSFVPVVVFLPYLLYAWTIWRLTYFVRREHPYDIVTDQLDIGRRLLAQEMIDGIDNVIDLTCEFAEPTAICSAVNYVSCPILDGSIPTWPQLRRLIDEINECAGTTYIHCAQGHGRTGLVAAALLMHRDPDLSPHDALRQLQAVRPALACNGGQMAMLSVLKAQIDADKPQL
ncbi:dual specificity protein phosphatase family protein [Symmachiella macrocystis]|nr:dual specificity protein phosphatase family protein [Symmachiella macrocystis]